MWTVLRAIWPLAVFLPLLLSLRFYSKSWQVLYHFVPADQMQMTMFFKNLGLAGGYLLLANAGSGAFSVDARKG